MKDLTWSVLPVAIEETSYRVWILARAEAGLNAGVVDNFQLASIAGLPGGSLSNAVQPWKGEVFTCGETVLCRFSSIC